MLARPMRDEPPITDGEDMGGLASGAVESEDEQPGTGGKSRSMDDAMSGACVPDGPASCSDAGTLLGWSGMSRIASCAVFHASRFCRHHSRCIVESWIASCFRSATFCLWNRSRSACSVVDAYLRSWAEAWSESSSCR